MHVLIADDDQIHCCLLSGLLRKDGHEVTVAKNGLESWTILQTNDTIQMAILDWHMPGMDGPEVCKRLRESQRQPYVYVILLTSNDQRPQLLEGLGAGADDYLTKPLDPPLLRARLQVGRRILDLQANLLATQEQLRYQADHDPLTGLYNRAGILVQLEREICRAKRDRTPLSVIMGDLDHFKRINDTHGHAAGDAALCQAARRITSSVRGYDVVGRFGGEEFLIVLPNCDAADALSRAEQIRERVARETMDLGGLPVAVTVSLGAAATNPFAAEEAAALIARADGALYQAKEAGRNRVQITQPNQTHQVLERGGC